MLEDKWLLASVENARSKAEKLREKIAADCKARDELDRLAAMDEIARQQILFEAQDFLTEQVLQVNDMAHDLAAYASAPVDIPTKMTPELFIHPANIAPRLLYRAKTEQTCLEFAYCYYWPIHFYETKLRLCLTISDKEEPLFVTAKDLTPNSLYRLISNNIEDVKNRLLRNIDRHVYLNDLYSEGIL
jgi:hypothetical protein